MKIYANKFYAAASVQGRTIIGPFNTVGDAHESAVANKLHVFAGAELLTQEPAVVAVGGAGKGVNPNFAAYASKGGKGGGRPNFGTDDSDGDTDPSPTKGGGKGGKGLRYTGPRPSERPHEGAKGGKGSRGLIR